MARAAARLVLMGALALGCRDPETVPTEPSSTASAAGPVPAASTEALVESRGSTVGEKIRVHDLLIQIDRFKRCKPHSYEKRPLRLSGTELVGIHVRVTREKAVADDRLSEGWRLIHPAQAVLSDSMKENYRFSFRGTCRPRLAAERLRPEQDTKGWITFEIPEGAVGLSVDLTIPTPVGDAIARYNLAR